MVASHARAYFRDLEAYKGLRDEAIYGAMARLQGLLQEVGRYGVEPLESDT